MFAIAQLRALGMSDGQIGRAVREGRLLRRHRGVYLDALAPRTPWAELRAALLCLGPSAHLDGRSALALAGVRPLDVHRIEVTVHCARTPRRVGLLVHRRPDPPAEGEVRVRDGLRVASPMTALVRVAGRETAAELDRLLAELCRRRLLDLDRLDAALVRRHRTPGAPRLRAALARYRAAGHGDTASSLEEAFAELLAAAPEIPAARRNVRLGRWEIDFLWPAQRVVVETDGEPYHRTPDELERDRLKDAWLQARGYRVLRVSGFRLDHDRDGIIADLRAVLAIADTA